MSNKTHPGIGYAHPHAEAAKNIAGQIDQTHVHADLGKVPLPKRAFTTTPEVHSGFNAKSRSDGTHFAGLSGQDISRYDANPGDDPLAGPPRDKVLSPVQASPGMRSRVNDALSSEAPGVAHDRAMLNKDQLLKNAADLSARVLAEAGNNSAPDDRRALGIGTLPGAVTED